MKRFVLAALLALPLQGCFFIMFPVPTGAISDAVSGASGDHCVETTAKVGDQFPAPEGGKLQIKSLSGASSRCTNPKTPIRAALVPVTT